MRQDEYFQRFNQILSELGKITESKNKDYAQELDAFKNFKQVEKLTDGKVLTEHGILTRMSDKWTRIANLLTRDQRFVADETIIDSLKDNAVYSLILIIYLEEKDAKEKRKLQSIGQEKKSDPLRELKDRDRIWTE